MYFCCLSHLVYGILLRQAEQTKTVVIMNYAFYMFAEIVLRNFASMFMRDIGL